jgi:hypothetical protein
VKDLEAEKQGVQEALKAALLMLSERFSHNPSAQNAHSNTVPASKPDIVTPRLESVAVSSVCCVRLLRERVCCLLVLNLVSSTLATVVSRSLLRFDVLW